MHNVFLPLVFCLTLTQPTTTTWLYGDSVAAGHGLGVFSERSPIDSAQGIANLLAAENGHPEITVAYAGTQDFAVLWEHRGVGPDDVIVFENAGTHFNDTEAYRNWLRLWKFAAGQNRLYLATTPDLPPATEDSQYDRPLAGGLSINQVVREEAVNLLDWDAEFEAKAHIVDLIQPDGIHPNAFGNFVMAVSLLRAQGVEVRSYASVLAAFSGYYPSINVPAVLAALAAGDPGGADGGGGVGLIPQLGKTNGQ